MPELKGANFLPVADMGELQRRIRESERIIGQAYRHCVLVHGTGDLAYAITAPLIEILTQPLVKESLTAQEPHDAGRGKR